MKWDDILKVLLPTGRIGHTLRSDLSGQWEFVRRVTSKDVAFLHHSP